MSTKKREMYEVWKEGYQWKTKLRHGVETTRTKRRAEGIAEAYRIVDGGGHLTAAQLQATCGW